MSYLTKTLSKARMKQRRTDSIPLRSTLYRWTQHAQFKMRFYGLSEARVRRVIKSPLRTEEGIAPATVAVMQPSSIKVRNGKRTWSQEIWVMYAVEKMQKEKRKRMVIISTWRYPGQTKPREVLPFEILNEINEALSSGI